jgi:hypothetical protein
VLLGALSLGALGASTGLALADSFRETPEAVEGQRTLERACRPASPSRSPSCRPRTPSTRSSPPPSGRRRRRRPGRPRDRLSLAVTSVVLDAAAGNRPLRRGPVALRERLAAVPGADAAVGG